LHDHYSGHDGKQGTHSFVTSPGLATSFAFSKSPSFNPVTDLIPNANGELFKFQHPEADELTLAFNQGEPLYQPPPPFAKAQQVDIVINLLSDQLQKLELFEAWKDGNSLDLQFLLKVQGKCTTDHIFPSGPVRARKGEGGSERRTWYDYRGHLDNISNNLLTALERNRLTRLIDY